MKRNIITILVLGTLTLVFAPVLITSITKSERRRFQAVKLKDTQYTEINFQNDSQNISLGGMLFIPEGDRPFPAVVVIHGSGTSRRDNGWYLTLTKYLQDNGIVVLLPDNRGSEKSGGDWRTSSLEDLSTDTLAAIQYLKNQDKFSISKIGIAGMSQGGRIAPIVASKSKELDFVVNVVGGAMSTHEQLFYEENYNVQQMGFLPGISNIVSYFSTYSLIYVRQKEFWDAVGDFNPIDDWKKMRVRSLVLYGENDTNTNSSESARRLNALNNPQIEVKIYEGSGHALEDPEGSGDSIFRKDALQKIRGFVFSANPDKRDSQ